MERRDRHRIPCELQDGGHPDDSEIEFVVSEEVESDAPPEAETETAVEAVVPEISEEPPPEAAEPIGEDPTPDGAEPADPEDPEPPEALQSSEALLVDDGELDDVYEALVALGADPIRQRAVGAEGFTDWEKPPRVVVVSARAAARVTVDTANAPRVVKIAVAEADSQTLCGMLRRQGFDFVVHRPVHPEALRLLLMRALYRGWERRSEPRLPLGCAVTTRWAIRWHPATLLEISSGGCSYLGQERLEEGTRAWVRIPRNVTGGRSLKLRGKVLRSESRRGEPSKASTVVAVAFDLFWKRTRKRLEALLAAAASGPPALPRAGGRVLPAAQESPPGAGADDPAGAAPRAPRLHPRAAYDQEVVVLDSDSERVRVVLFARDLSVGGVRVDPHPNLRLGDRFQLALYNAFFSESVVVDAEVLRDDGERGIVLRFLDTPEHTTRKIDRILERSGEIERCDAPGEAHDVTVVEVVQEDRA